MKATNYTVEDLEPDVEYEFRVSAENSIGTSEPVISNPLKYGQSRCLSVNQFFSMYWLLAIFDEAIGRLLKAE